MTGPREAELLEATDLLLNARRTLSPIANLPTRLIPVDLAEVIFVQDQIAAALGSIGGWKVGAPSAEATPMAAPMPLAGIGANNAALAGGRLRGLEAEVAFLLGKDLPPRAEPYTRAEIANAIHSCHPAIEVLESALVNPADPSLHMTQSADLLTHGGFIFGPAVADWQTIDFTQEPVTLSIDGTVRVERTGSNPSGDLHRLLPWLANEHAARTGGLHAGQWITTGSWTGAEFAMAGSAADVHFPHLGRVSLHFV